MRRRIRGERKGREGRKRGEGGGEREREGERRKEREREGGREREREGGNAMLHMMLHAIKTFTLID